MTIDEAAKLTGEPRMAISQYMHLYGFEDPLFAAAFIHASSLAVYIPVGRHEWNLRRAKEMVLRLAQSTR